MKWLPSLAGLMLAACAAQPNAPQPAGPADLVLAPYRAALGKWPVYQVDAGRSRADVVVRRAGSLRTFGHDHVLTVRSIEGYVMLGDPAAAGSRADLVVGLTDIVIDDAAARSVYRLDTEPSEADIAGTGRNLHDEVLETATWPRARIGITITEPGSNPARCEVTLEVKDTYYTMPVDVWLDYDDSELRARGLFDLRQSDIGIEPFSLLGGALSVSDRIEISFLIGARRTDSIVSQPSR